MNELELMAGSFGSNDGELLAEGALARLRRRVSTFGFHLATLDVRQHAARLHECVADLFARVGVDLFGRPRHPRDRCSRPS